MAAKKKKSKKKKSTTKAKKKAKSKIAQTRPEKMAEIPLDPNLRVTPHPTSSRVVDFEDKLDEQITGGPPETPKRPRGRPPGPAQAPGSEEPGAVPIERKVIADFVKMPFDVWATSQRMKGLLLTDQEVQSLIDPVMILLDYYVPEVPAIAYAWAGFAITAYSVTAPRLRMIEQVREERKIKNEALRQANQNRPDQQRGPAATPTSSSSGQFPRPDEITPLEIKH